MKTTEEKTNVMRLLDRKKIEYQHYCYAESGITNGVEVANYLNQDARKVFKTLVTTGKTNKHYVFVIPVAEELDLKKAAKAVGEKSIVMLKQKDLLPLTGYIHGGCSPIGMKKQFVTVVHETVQEYPTMIFSGGKVGYQVEISYQDLKKMIPCSLGDIVVSK